MPGLVPTSAVVGETPARLARCERAGRRARGRSAGRDLRTGRPRARRREAHARHVGDPRLHSGDAPARAARGAYPLALWELEHAGRAFCLEGTVVTAGAAIDWLVDLGLLASAGDLDAVAARAPTPEGVVCVPALQGLGTPRLDSAARAIAARPDARLARRARGARDARRASRSAAPTCAKRWRFRPDRCASTADWRAATAFVAALADAPGREVWRARGDRDDGARRGVSRRARGGCVAQRRSSRRHRGRARADRAARRRRATPGAARRVAARRRACAQRLARVVAAKIPSARRAESVAHRGGLRARRRATDRRAAPRADDDGERAPRCAVGRHRARLRRSRHAKSVGRSSRSLKRGTVVRP